MSIILNIILIVLVYVLQTTLMPVISLWGITPNLVFIFVICFAMFNGREKGMIMALAMGLLLDMLTTYQFGLVTVLMTTAAVLTTTVFARVFSPNISTALVSVGVCNLGYNLLLVLGMSLFGQGHPIFYDFFRIILPEAIYNMLLTFPIFLLLDQLCRSGALDWTKTP